MESWITIKSYLRLRDVHTIFKSPRLICVSKSNVTRFRVGGIGQGLKFRGVMILLLTFLFEIAIYLIWWMVVTNSSEKIVEARRVQIGNHLHESRNSVKKIPP